MGAVFPCEICGGQAHERDELERGEFICPECHEKALRIGIQALKWKKN
jgi:Zn finger protein HypA/HybF involved in hydrogenase expression